MVNGFTPTNQLLYDGSANTSHKNWNDYLQYTEGFLKMKISTFLSRSLIKEFSNLSWDAK